MPEQCRLTDLAQVPADAHGCPACPHSCIGPAISGSPNVKVEGLPFLRVTDPGIHAACCGPNTWKVANGSGTVFCNNLAAARKGDPTTHCGGSGTLKTGSGKVKTGG